MSTTSTTWVLITGASSGFGEEFARQYAARGRALVLVARRLDRLQSLADALRAEYGIKVLVERVDLADIDAIEQLHARLHAQGVIVDVLINNAGHGLQGPFLDAPLASALSMVQVDIAALTALTRLFGDDMRQRGRGQILLVASILANFGVQGMAVYSASKAYVLRLGDALHREFAEYGVTVTSLSPGMSDTEFARTAQQKITWALSRLMMKPEPVVKAGIRALDAGRVSVTAGFNNKMAVALVWATPNWLHQRIFRWIMAGNG